VGFNFKLVDKLINFGVVDARLQTHSFRFDDKWLLVFFEYGICQPTPNGLVERGVKALPRLLHRLKQSAFDIGTNLDGYSHVAIIASAYLLLGCLSSLDKDE
jgi:hypothetical protein